jgi:hypothetical protein
MTVEAEREATRRLSVSIVIRKDIRKRTAGEREVERKGKDRSRRKEKGEEMMPSITDQKKEIEESGDEDMADDEFDDFVVTDDDLKRILKITEPPQLLQYPYDNPNDLNSMLESTMDSSGSDDDEGGAVAMQVESESDSEVDIDPYWSKVTVDELQGLGKPIQLYDGSDTDSIPDLESVTSSEDEDDEDDDFILADPSWMWIG